MFPIDNGGVPGSNTPIGPDRSTPNGLVLPVPTPSKDVILSALAVLFEPDQVIEMRAFPKGRKQTISGYFDHSHWSNLADQAVQLNASGAAVYVTLNPVDPQLLNRYNNRTESYAKATTTDKQIIGRRWLLVDLDPVRPTETSATEAQLKAAGFKARAIYKHLKRLGWADPVAGCSGNGYHLYYAIDIKNDDESTKLVKAVLSTLAKQFDDELVKVDETVYNASRICKLPGTVANKGDHTDNAPWRLSALLHKPTRTLVSIEQLRMLLQPASVPVSINLRTSTVRGTFDLEDFLDRHGLEHTADQHDGRDRFKLKVCPFNNSHVNGEAAIFRDSQGVLGFKCMHNSCASQSWKTLRERLEGPQVPEPNAFRKSVREQAEPIANETASSLPAIEWPEPLEIETDLPAAPDFDAKTLLPPTLADFVLDEADRMPCSPEYIAATLLVAVGSVIGARCGIKPKRRDDWVVAPNLFGGLVGPPSSKKTPAMNTVVRFLDRLEARWAEKLEGAEKDYNAEMAAFEAYQGAVKAEMKRAAAGKSDPLKMGAAIADLSVLEEPEKPHARRFKSNDPTIEKLGDLLVHNPQGLLVVRDELSGLLASWEAEGKEGDKAFYLEGWNGTSRFSIDRIGRGSLHIKNLCISVFGGIQPELLERYLAGISNSLDNDGRIQRFQVLVYPNTVTWEWRDRYPVKGAREAVRDLFDRLASFDPLQDGAAPSDDFVKLPHFSFDDAAQEIFIEWCTELHTVHIANEQNPLMQQHLGKFEKLFCSLALILHLAEGSIGPVTANSALRAAAWCEYLTGHARRIYGLVEASKVTTARMVSRRLAQGKLEDGFTVRDLVRKQWSGVTTTMQAETALGILEDSGHVQSQDSINLGRPTVRYYINPKIKKVSQ